MRLRPRLGIWGSVLVVIAACAGSNSTKAGFGTDGGTDAGMADQMILGSDQMSPETNGCAAVSYVAQQDPAALLFVLDASGSMGNDNKYANAQQAIVAAMDLDAFDTMYLGLLLYPNVQPVSAMCPNLLGIPVNCAVSGLPQVPLGLAGSDTSNQTGVRQAIYQMLANSAPAAGPGNGNPSYDALQNAVTTLQGLSLQGKRLLFFITDGGASCTSQDTPQRPAYTDGNGCQDWEDPGNIVTLLKNAHDDANAPVHSFIVGVKGADTTNPGGADPNLPPYSVRLSLSAYALAGSPETAPMGCNGTYTQTGADPTIPCHFDLSTMPSFTQTLSNDIALIRNQLLGCVFDLPTPDSGMVNRNEVNVDYSLGGGTPTDLKKRVDPTDMCATDGCWDYTTDGKVQLIGKACSDVEGSPSAKVDIVVGCTTVTK